jgi:NarL family two-component system response regulator YdfI
MSVVLTTRKINVNWRLEEVSEKSIRVLIVDDLPQVRDGLTMVLNLASKATTPKIEIIGEAQNGIEAIQQARALYPDVIMMDLEMPLLDGYEAARQIKAHRPSCRIIALTVHDHEDARQKASQAGIDAFIVKGAPIEILVQEISER